MNLIKKLFGKKERSVKSDSKAPFIVKLEHDFIPRLMEMINKEKDHLDFLKQSNAPKRMIQASQKSLEHFEKRLQQYNDYLAHLKALRAEMIP